ncbi:MAG: hypothetical protein K8R36_20890 [Planctomycetales bacterium]|nr:hypothetical protein [Planctomycetales bacterium]
MSSTLEQPTTTTGELTHPGPSPASVLIDRLPESWKLSQATAGLSALLALYFLFVNYQPVTHLEVWDHLAFGRLIATNRALPQTEPFLPLMRGIPTADTSWLGQTVAYLAYNRWGAAALQFLNGLGVAGCFVALAWFGCRQLRSAPWTLAGMAMLFILDWYQFTILRPQTAGLFCFVLLVTASTARRVQFRDWLLVPALFALWANLHGSFLAGLAWLACLSVGRAIDLWRRTGHVMAFRNDAPFRRLVMLTELAAVATLLNPFGTGIYRQLLEYFQNSNLRSLLEWDPLQIRTGPGSAAAVAALALAVVYRLTPRRISSSEILAHLAFGGRPGLQLHGVGRLSAVGWPS